MHIVALFNNTDRVALIIKTLAQDEGSIQALGQDVSASLQEAQAFFSGPDTDDEASLSQMNFTQPLLEAFARATDPTYTPNGLGGRGTYIDWIAKTYAQRAAEGNPIKSEDLYKIGEELAYFRDAKNKIKAEGHSPDIGQYDTYDSFISVVRPLMLGSQQNKKKKGLSDEIRAETTILYDKPKVGKIVIPHTVRSSQFWGRITTWCISGKDANEDFPRENRKSPVVMFIPKNIGTDHPGITSGKIAVVDNIIYNELDKKIDAFPDYLMPLLYAAMGENSPLSDGAYRYLQMFGNKHAFHRDYNYKPVIPVDHLEKSLPADQKEILSEIMDILEKYKMEDKGQKIGKIFDDNPVLKTDKNFFLVAGAKVPWLFGIHADESLRSDKDLVLALIRRRRHNLGMFLGMFYGNEEVMLTAIRYDRSVFSHYDSDLDTLKQKHGFLLKAMLANSGVRNYYNELPLHDLDFVEKFLDLWESDPERHGRTLVHYVDVIPALFGGASANIKDLRKKFEAYKQTHAQTAHEPEPGSPHNTPDPA